MKPNETDTDGMGRFSPNGISESDGDYECNHGSCKSDAEWDIELIDRHAQHGLVRACDDHVADVWGYHPEETDRS